MKLAIIGCGNMGSQVARAMENDASLKGRIRVYAVYDIDASRAAALSKSLASKPMVCKDVSEILKNDDITYVLEAASQEAVRLYGKDILASGKNVLVMSVGAFTDDGLLDQMKYIADKKGLKIIVPSGAVVGIDGLKSAGAGVIRSVTLTTRKNPKSLGMDVDKETILYDGPAREGIKKYPKNVNVASTISLAGIGLDKTRLKLIADPKVDKNIHEMTVIGDFGEYTIRTENVPSPDNPATSMLAVLSAIATLKKITEAVQIGT